MGDVEKPWNRCDDCGRFIPLADFESGAAVRNLVSDFPVEEFVTLCPEHRDADWRNERTNTIAREHIISPSLRLAIREALKDAEMRTWARERESCRNLVKVASEMGENRMRAAVIGELREPSDWLVDPVAEQLADAYDMPPSLHEQVAREVLLVIANSLDIDTALSIDLSADEAKFLEPHS